MGRADPAAAARRIVEANRYLTLATADAEGAPWASPVWFAHEGCREFVWISRPEARHSRNLTTRPQVAIVIFDSTVPEGEGTAVYVEARAGEVDEADHDGALAICARRSAATGDAVVAATDVLPPAEHRLYRATATALFLLDEHDQRVAVPVGLN